MRSVATHGSLWPPQSDQIQYSYHSQFNEIDPFSFASNAVTLINCAIGVGSFLYFRFRVTDEVDNFYDEMKESKKQLEGFRDYWRILDQPSSGFLVQTMAQRLVKKCNKVIEIIDEFAKELNASLEPSASSGDLKPFVWKQRRSWLWNRNSLQKKVVHVRNLKIELILAYLHTLAT